MNVVIYVRVSTQEQAKEGYSIGEQIERLNKYCDAMQWNIVETFIDPGYSGGDTQRPGLKDLIKTVEEKDIDKVVVYKLDRLSRSQKDTLFLIEDVFLKHNTDFVSMNENFDTSTPFGRAMIGILAVFAQLEREQIKERMTMGKEARAKEGKWGGGATEPIGYDYDPVRDLLVVNECEAMQVRELYQLFLEGIPLRSIEGAFIEKGYTHKHGMWTAKTMRRLMANKIYLGYIRHHQDFYKAEHDPIIDVETFEKAQELLKVRAEQYKLNGVVPGKVTTYLGGLLYCKHCGGKYAKQENSRRKPGKPLVWWYMCHSRCKKIRAMVKDPNCKNKNWKMQELDNVVLDEIAKLAVDPEYIKQLQADKPKTETPSKIDTLEKEIKKLDDRISRFMDLYGIGKFTIDQVSSKVDPLNETRKKLQRELDTLNTEAGRLTPEEAVEIAASFEEIVEYGGFDEKRFLIEQLIRKIELDNDEVTIHWNFN